MQCGHGVAQEGGLGGRVGEAAQLGFGRARRVVVVHVPSPLVPWTSSASASTASAAAFAHRLEREEERWGSRGGLVLFGARLRKRQGVRFCSWRLCCACPVRSG